jgi:phosphoribosylanthranilate isomerase
MAVEAGADAVGFIVDVPQSPRNLSRNEAKKLMELTPIFIETVAVTVPKDLNHLEKFYEDLSPNIIQIHGFNILFKDLRTRLPDARIIGAVQIKPNLDINSIIQRSEVFNAILLDSGEQGGTGKTHNWEISKKIRTVIHPKPIILAGGLKSENVKEAIFTVRPYAVDVSSGVELKPGEKDRKKVFEFIKKVKEIDVK